MGTNARARAIGAELDEQNASMAAVNAERLFTTDFPSPASAGDEITARVGSIVLTAFVVYDDDRGIDDDEVHVEDRAHDAWEGATDETYERAMAARAAWLRDEWFYCGIRICASIAGMQIGHVASLWGIECNYPVADPHGLPDNSYLREIANELLPEAIEAARQGVAERLTEVARAAASLLAESD
jgi:hypothetical protein